MENDYEVSLTGPLRDFDDGFDNRLRRIGWRGKYLEHSHLAAIDPNAVGKSAAGVYGNVERLSSR